MKMTEAEFQRIYRYVKLHYGIDMSKKKEIMTGRLENYVVVHGYASYDAFMNALETDPTGHMEKRLIGMLTTNHTFFMREFEHMEYLSRVVLPELSKKEAKTKDLGIWCAAASSGEEPYMLVMLIKDYFGLDHANWDTTILATDVSAEILEQATRGIYTADAIAPMPAQWKRRYFKACPDGLHYQVTDEIKKESEINVAKEDTAIAPAVESVLQDTVEWVASTKTPAGNGQEYEEVGKSDIPEPAQARLLEPEIKYAYFAKETQIVVFDQPREESPAESENTPPSESESSSESESTKPSESEGTKPTESESESGSSKPTESESTKPSESESTKPSESESATESSTAATEPTKTPETKPEEVKVKKITISGSATVEVGQTVSLSVTVSPDNAANKSVRWEIVSGKEFVSVDDKGTVKGVKAGEAKIKAVAQDGSNVESGISTVKVTEKKINRGDTKTLLKDKNGNQLYCKDGDTYREATTADYYTKDKFYRKKANVEYRYTGWQTIDGKRFFYDKNGTAVTGEQVIQGVKYTFNGDGSLNTGTVMGIDISKHNGNIDWNAVKNSGVQYVILRCGYRGSASGVLVEDQKFKSNIQGATAAGLKVGIYFFSQAVNEVEAVEEASMTLSLIKKYRITYPVYIDVESANGRADGISKAARTSVINAFCQTIRNSGYTPGLYANKNWLTEKINTGALGGCKIWLAQYVAAPTYGGRYEMWQYSSRGSIAGIKGNVDLNVSYMGY